MILCQEKYLFTIDGREVFLKCIPKEALEKIMRELHYCLKNDPACADELKELESLNYEEQKK